MKFYSLTIVLICLIVFISGCRYEDGPAISFRSANSRIQGTYDIKKFEYGGADSTFALKSKSCYGEITIDIDDGIYMNRGGCATSGSWDLKDNNKKIAIQFHGGNFIGIPPWGLHFTADYEILQLKDHEMVLSTNYNGKFIKIELCE